MNKQTVIRKITHFTAFQGSEIDEKLLKEVQIALSDCYGNGTVEKLYQLAEKIKNLKLSSKFTFVGINKWKYICAILLEIFGQEYRHGHYMSEITELIGYITKSVKRSRVMNIIDIINITDNNEKYVKLINSVINLSDDEFLKFTE